MIVDYLENIPLYISIHKNLALGFNFLTQRDLISLSLGKHEIDGENVFATISEYHSKTLDEGKWEAHKNYIDIQLVISGIEKIGYAPFKNMVISQPYNQEKDYSLFDGNGVFLEANPSNFFVFYPQDVHMPGITVGQQEMVKKLVVKVRI